MRRPAFAGWAAGRSEPAVRLDRAGRRERQARFAQVFKPGKFAALKAARQAAAPPIAVEPVFL
ncbi:hypothetical protein VE23_10760 [Paenibacillus sp. D9]|nr:hypothetical protein VE23_10760 [Paenibacillus sp. D9]